MINPEKIKFQTKVNVRYQLENSQLSFDSNEAQNSERGGFEKYLI